MFGFGRLALPPAGGRVGDLAASIFASYGTPGILLGDLNPARLTASGLSPSYLESTGLTAASSSGQTLGLLLERSGGAAIGADVLNGVGVFDSATGWSGAATTISGGELILGPSAGSLYNAGLVVGKRYLVTNTITGIVASGGGCRVSLGNDGLGSARTTAGTLSELLTPLGNNSSWIRFFSSVSPFFTSANIDNLTVMEIAGNHLYQATSADEPTLILANGIWRIRGDGASKNFLTPLAPSASFTGIWAGEMNAASDVMFGASVGSDIVKLGTHSDGKLRVYVGTTTADVTAASIVDVPGVAGIRWSGTSYYGFWQPLSGGTPETASGTFSGSIPTTQPIRLLAENDDGTAASPADGDCARFMAQQAAWSDAQIAAVSNQYRAAMGGW